MDGPTVVTTPAEVIAAATGTSPETRVPVAVHLPVSDPFEAYRRARTGPGGAFLETTGGQSGWNYFGVDPVERLTVGPDAVAIEDGSATLAALEGFLADRSLVRTPTSSEIPYPCGAVGWLSYDVARELETLPDETVDDRTLPQLELALFDRLAAWKAPVDGPVTLQLTACPRIGSDPEEAFERGRSRALELARAIRDGDEGIASPRTDEVGRFESECGREAYADRVRTVKAYVREGDTFQANISQRLVAPATVHPVEAFAALRDVNPAPYSCLLEYPAVDLVSASPELLLDRDGPTVRTEPIAGTRPRGETAAEDARLERELRCDEKERAEHAMLVDLERNDLGKVCTYGSVSVAQYRRVDRYAEVMHLVSDVRGTLRPDAGLADAIAAVFPGGTITGAPKPRTMAIIDEVETTRRGTYTGSVGIFGLDGRATLNIVIRTLVRHADEYHLRVGAGIVHDSAPIREYDETLDKARALIRAIDEALGSQVALAVEPDGGIDGARVGAEKSGRDDIDGGPDGATKREEMGGRDDPDERGGHS